MKERLLRAGRIGLAVAAITSGLTADACAKKPPVPLSPVGITEKAPQFSDTSGDRPLQGQEKLAGQDWTSYTSPNFFRMDYPSSWQIFDRTNEVNSTSVIFVLPPLPNENNKRPVVFHLSSSDLVIKDWIKRYEDWNETKAVEVTLRTQNKSKQTAWKISSDYNDYYIFPHKGAAWQITILHEYVSEEIREKMMQSFTLLGDADNANVKTAVDNTKPKPASSDKKTEQGPFSKKPKDLFKALLTTPMRPDELVLGITPGKQTAEELDKTEQALGAVGKVIIAVSKISKQQGFIEEGTISYTVFPDAQKAKAAYDVLMTAARKKSDIPIPNFSGYSTIIETEGMISSFASQYQVVAADRNVVIVVKFGSIVDNTDSLTEVANTGIKAIKHLDAIAEK